MRYAVSIFNGRDRKLIGPMSENDADKLRDRLLIRAGQIGMDSDNHHKPSPPAIKVFELCALGDIPTLENLLTFKP